VDVELHPSDTYFILYILFYHSLKDMNMNTLVQYIF